MSNEKLKIILFRSAGIEIDHFIQRFTKKRFNMSYKLELGVDILNKEVEYESGKKVQLSIWDIGDHLRYKFVRSKFYRGAVGCISIFDLNKPQSFEFIRKRILEIYDYINNKRYFIIIGINIDIPEKSDISIENPDVQEFIEKYCSIYYKATKNNNNIEDLFVELTRRIMYSRI